MKIENKIILLLFVFGVIPIILLSYIYYDESKKTIKDEVLKNLKFVSSNKSLMIEKIFNEEKQKILLMSKREYIINQTKNILRTYKTDKQKYKYYMYKLDILSKNHININNFEDIYITSVNGDIIYTANKKIGFQSNIHQFPTKGTLFEKSFNKSLKINSLYISDFRKSKIFQKIITVVSTPIVDNNKTIAIVSVVVSIDILYDVVLTNTNLSKTLESIIVEKDKDKILFLSPLKFSEKSKFKNEISINNPMVYPVKLALNGENGFAIKKDYRGVEVLAVWQYIPMLDIALIVKKDVAEAYQNLYKLKYFMFYIFLISLFFLGYVFYLILKIIKELQKQKQRYEIAIEGANEGLWEWDFKTNTVELSKKAKEIIQYEKNITSFENVKEFVHPDDFKYLNDYIKKVMKTKEPYKITYRIVRKDKSIRWILDRAKIVYENNKPVKMVGFFTDITRDKELEEEVKKTKEFYELILDSFPHMVVIKDKNSIVLYANKKAKDFVRKDMVGKNPFENIGEKAGKEVEKLSQEAIKHGKSEKVIKYKKNDIEFYFHAISFIISKKDKIYLIGSTYYDVTNHEKTKLELRKKDELMIIQSRYAAMGEMIGMIAHQWRQPIAAIAMDVNNMLVDIELDNIDIDEFKNSLNGILNQTKHLSDTIDDFRNFFRQKKDKETVKIIDVLNDVLKIIGKSLQNNNIELTIKNNSNSVLNIYARELLQVFLNLFSNAKYALVENKKEGRKIDVVIDEDEKIVKILVCDNGGGIKDDIIHKIFEPYFSTKPQKQGTGIGLYMSKMIIDKHLYGTIEAYNKEDGACFKIVLYKENMK